VKRTVAFVISFLVIVLGNAFSQDVRYNFDKNTDFSKFKTYKWVTLKGAAKVNDIVDNNIKAAIDKELAAKGLTKVDTDTADLFVGYQAAVGQQQQFTSYGSDWGYGPGWYRGGWYGPMSTPVTGQTSTIYVGELAIDMYDSANHELVWRGLATKTIDQTAKPDKQEKNIQKAVNKLLKKYPPEKKS
jgi:Domain of unknown function (DUF4136)